MSHVVREVKDKNGCFCLSVSYLENSFSLTVLRGKNAYTANITSDYLEKQSKSLKQDFEEYCNKLKQYFEEENINVSIGFKESQKVLEVNFIISTGSSVKYFSVELIDSDFSERVQIIINKLNTHSKDALLQLKQSQDENAMLKNELANYKSKLEKFVNAKKLSDKELLRNFVVLLNEKKSKIQYLTELLDAFKNGRETKNPPVKRKERKTIKSEEKASEVDVKKARKEVISESESEESVEENYDSEEEKRRKLDEILAIPSTSKADFGFLKEDTPPRELPKIIEPFANKTADNKLVIKSQEIEENVEEPCKLQEKNAESPKLQFNTQDMLDEL